VETGMWPDQRHTADNTAAFFTKRIEALGKRSVCAPLFITVLRYNFI